MALDLFRQKLSCNGVVLFRGALAPRLEELELGRSGVQVKSAEAQPDAQRVAQLTHPKWGAALLMAPREPMPPPRTIIDSDYTLDERDKALAYQAGCGLLVRTMARKASVLDDRKTMLRFLRAIMGVDGLMAYDPEAFRFWPRQALDEELSHDAPLDVEAIFTLHYVTAPDQPGWLHTHGLAEVGAKDFDILDPHDSVGSVGGHDLLRAIAFAVLEGSAAAGQKFVLARPGGTVEFVDVSRFGKKTAPQWVQLRAMDDDSHEHNRLVICEPRSGLLGRWLSRYEPSRLLRKEIDDGIVFPFSSAATEMMAERARGTFSVLRSLCEEFAGLDVNILTKIGYPTDTGGKDGREHLWFSVHGCDDNSVDGTLENDPFDIAALKRGMRSWHAAENLTDWLIISPVGTVSPRDMRNLRLIRENRDELQSTA